jgi:hypothetical protein
MAALKEIEEENREITIVFTVLYLRGILSNANLIDMKVWFGLLPAIPPREQEVSQQLIMKIVEIKGNTGEDSTDISFLIGVAIIMDEIKRIFTLAEQKLILKALRS